MRRIVLLYMPVIHRGYLDFLREHGSSDIECLLLGINALEALGDEAKYVLKKDFAIRGLPERIVKDFVQSLGIFKSVDSLVPRVEAAPVLLTMPDEDVNNLAGARFFPAAELNLDQRRLRYDRRGLAREDPVPAARATSEEVHWTFMRAAEAASLKSKDWWLQVGALIARDGEPLFTAWNEAALDGDLPNIIGDPRSLFTRGENAEDTLAAHAERRLVARAAREGISLHGTDAYITHFPCVACAESLSDAGVKRVFFKQGYSRLEAAELLQAKGVEIIQVI